jgi:hypothetical protein
LPHVTGYSGRRADDTPPPRRRASDSDAWLVMAMCMPYAVPVETVVRQRPKAADPLPFKMFRRVSMAEVRAARVRR